MAQRLSDNIDELDSATKAAVLLMTLDDETAGRLLRCMPSDMIEDVTRVLASLGEIPAALSMAVLEAFHGQRQPALQIRRTERWMAPATSSRFAFLHHVESDMLAACIQHEQPRTVALIASHLPRRQASDVLMRLPDPVQSEVVELMSQMRDPGDQVIRAVELALASSLAMMHTPPVVEGERIKNIEDLVDFCNLDTARMSRSDPSCP